MSRPREFDVELVLQTAMRMFWQRGYNGVSIAELSTAMNISTPSLYAAFGSKQDLYREALRAYQQRPNAVSPAVLDHRQPIRQALIDLLNRAIETVTELSPSPGCMVATGFLTGHSCDGEAAEFPAALRRALLDALTLRFQRAVDAGEISAACAPKAMARYVFAAIQGISVQARDGASRADLEQFATLALQSLVADPSKPHTQQRASCAKVIGDTPPRAQRWRALGQGLAIARAEVANTWIARFTRPDRPIAYRTLHASSPKDARRAAQAWFATLSTSRLSPTSRSKHAKSTARRRT